MSWLEEKKKAYAASEEARKAKVAENNERYKARKEEINQNYKKRMAEIDQNHAAEKERINQETKTKKEVADQKSKERMEEFYKKHPVYSAGVTEYNRFNEQISYSIEVWRDALHISRKKENPEVIAYSDIISVQPYTETELKTQNKSVLGRAVVGGALLGGAGAIVGGMTGLNKREVEKDRRYIILTYRKDGELTERVFETINLVWKKLVLAIEERIAEESKSDMAD